MVLMENGAYYSLPPAPSQSQPPSKERVEIDLTLSSDEDEATSSFLTRKKSGTRPALDRDLSSRDETSNSKPYASAVKEEPSTESSFYVPLLLPLALSNSMKHNLDGQDPGISLADQETTAAALKVVNSAKRRKTANVTEASLNDSVAPKSLPVSQELDNNLVHRPGSHTSRPDDYPVLRGLNGIKDPVLRSNEIQLPSSQKSQNVEEGGPDPLRQAIKTQIFSLVRSELSKYRRTLNAKQRRAIGREVAIKLALDKGFARDFTTNGNKLSPAFIQMLPGRLIALLNEHLSKFFEAIAASARTKNESLKQIPSINGNVQGSSKIAVHSQTDNKSSSASNIQPQADALEKNITRLVEANVVELSSPVSAINKAAKLDETHEAQDIQASRKLSFDHIPHPEIHDHTKARPARQKLSKRRHRNSVAAISKLEAEVTTSLDKLITPKAEYNSSVDQKSQSWSLAGLANINRPYISADDLSDIRRSLEIYRKQEHLGSDSELQDAFGDIVHVGFNPEEISLLCKVIRFCIASERGIKANSPEDEIMSLMAGRQSSISQIRRQVREELKKRGPERGRALLQNRSTTAIVSFLHDAATYKITKGSQITRLGLLPRQKRQPKSSIVSLLRQRELGHRMHFEYSFMNHLEDSLSRFSEWTDCCGDIITLVWTSSTAFVCGATAHSDFYNMQYNKPGNLLLGSTALDTLRAVPDHRIVRPIVDKRENSENASYAMRQSQEPWLYTSVVSSCHCELNGLSFTASFDKTVKVWTVTQVGVSMELRGTWEHEEKVNFVVTSSHHELVATASDVFNHAIRVYHLDKDNISSSRYDTYTGEKAFEQAQWFGTSSKWAYFPATIEWGRVESVAHHLLVGYSPRSMTGSEYDVPEDKRNTGQLCMWNVITGQPVVISTARNANVFEVLWHPSQPRFLAATSPCGSFGSETKTQIRIFAPNHDGNFVSVRVLDSPALDIETLTIRPNALKDCYITAGCTDSRTYVWDTAQGDKPIHVLSHGAPLDNPVYDLPRHLVDDVGIRFSTWGSTTERFYTGSSDGKVKAWNVRAPSGKAFVRDVLSASGGISAGAFSQDFSKLVIGDATGKVHLLGLDNDNDDNEDEMESLTGLSLQNPFQAARPTTDRQAHSEIKRPKVVIPHAEPESPYNSQLDNESDEAEETAQSIAKSYLETGQLVFHPDRQIGVVKGPNYADTRLFRAEAHQDQDPTKGLLPNWQQKQRSEIHQQDAALTLSLLKSAPTAPAQQHAQNMLIDWNVMRLCPDSLESLKQQRADLILDEDYNFEYEKGPRFAIFSDEDGAEPAEHISQDLRTY